MITNLTLSTKEVNILNEHSMELL